MMLFQLAKILLLQNIKCHIRSPLMSASSVNYGANSRLMKGVRLMLAMNQVFSFGSSLYLKYICSHFIFNVLFTDTSFQVNILVFSYLCKNSSEIQHF